MKDNPFDKDIKDAVHKVDVQQMKEANENLKDLIPELAKSIYTFYSSLFKVGFTKKQALKLTINIYVSALINTLKEE